MSIKEMESTARELRGLQRMKDELDAEIEALQDTLKAALGDTEQMVVGEYKVTWKPVTSQRVDAKALREALPEVAERFTKTTTVRRFQVK